MAIINLSTVNQADNVEVGWSVSPPGSFDPGNIRCEYDVATNGGVTTVIPHGQNTNVGNVSQCRARQSDRCACFILDPISLSGQITVTVEIKVGTKTVLNLTGTAGPGSDANSAIIDETLRFV